MTASEIEIETPDPVHAAKLRGAPTKKAMIQYACEVLGRPTTEQVQAWLEAYEVETTRPYTSATVNAWRRERGMSDTGDLPALTAETLAELDAKNAYAWPDDDVQDASSSQVTDPEGESDALTCENDARGHRRRFRFRRSETQDGSMVDGPLIDVAAEADRARAGEQDSRRKRPAGAVLFYLVAIAATAFSADTSYRWFGEVIKIKGPEVPVTLFGVSMTVDIERLALFSVIELALLACGYAMRANVRRTGQPGAPQWVAWLLLGFSTLAAFSLEGFAVSAFGRVMAGPLLALIMLHMAMGIEISVKVGRSNGTAARVGRELRERALSRLGLSDEGRDAVEHSRERALRKAARLAVADPKARNRDARLARALRASNVAHDPSARARLLAEIAVLQHASDLANVSQPSPWAVADAS